MDDRGLKVVVCFLFAMLFCAVGADPFPSPTWSVRAVPDGERAAPRLWQGISPKVRAWEKSGRAETLSRVGRGPSLAVDAASCLLPPGASAAHPAPVFVICDAAAVPTNALLKRGYAVARGRFCATPAASLVQRPELDATRVAVVGSSDALWAAAHDERIAMVVFAGRVENEVGGDRVGDLLRLMAPRLACPVGVRKDALSVARDLYAAYGIPERLFAQAAAAPALRPSDWVRIIDFADRELKAPSSVDSDEIERCLAAAVADGSRTLTLGRNAASADGVWRIVRAIRVPDDFTLLLDGCRVELADRTQDNLIRNAGAAEGATKPNRGIRILGKNGAVLSAGVRNHYRPRRSGDPNGWRSVGILLCDVSDYEIGGLKFEETQCWAISQERCHHGRIHDLVFGSTDRFYNQDGVDVRKGCHDLVIENISGAAGDDAVALTALRIPAAAPERFGMQIGGNRSRGEADDVYNVTVRNVRARSSGGHGVIRLLTADGIRMHHIVVSNVVDTASGNEKRPFATIRIGDMNYSTISRCKMGEMHHIAVSGVKASGAVAVSIRGPLCDSSVTDITPVPGGKRYAVTAPLERVALDDESAERSKSNVTATGIEQAFRTSAEHAFKGVWITDEEMAAQVPRPFKARELKRNQLPPEDKKLCNRHILFRKAFDLGSVKDARVLVTADDYYKLYVNGVFAGQGPAAGMVEHTYYNEIDVTRFLKPGRNVLAVHTYYQGLVNRVWVSGDRRHGLILDLVADGRTVVASGTDFRTARHTGYAIADNDNGWCGRRGTVGYDTQFLERYDAAAPEVGFARPDFDDSGWKSAVRHPLGKDYRLFPQPTPSVVTETIRPASVVALSNGTLRIDFGGVYVGGMVFAAHGPKGAEVVIKCGQELKADGSVRHKMRCNCNYVEQMILSGGPRDVADPFDYKSFRYAELEVPPGATVDRDSIVFRARHTPFALKAKPNFGDDPIRQKIWNLCVNSFRYGVQEQIMDCMDREKGYYLGDGVYTMYAYCTLTQDWEPARRFFDDFLRTRDIDRGLVTCANCAFMQEIAEYPLMLILFARLYLEATGDVEFIRSRYAALADVLDTYRERYARPDGLIANIDKWCVVEWPDNYRDGYDADVRAGKVCTDVHNAVNAWYVGAVKTMNWVAAKIGRAPYADATRLQDAFDRAFWDSERKVFVDRIGSKHASMPANVYAAFFDLMPASERAAFKANFLKMARAKFPDAVNMFQYMPLFFYLQREGEKDLLVEFIRHPGAWRRMLAEDATRSFEGWGKDTKWNTSLFHLTTASVAVFLTDVHSCLLVDRQLKDHE